MIFVLWFFFSLVVGAMGSGRNIGFWGAFLLSLILSPLIGFIIVIFSSSKAIQEDVREIKNSMSQRTNHSQVQELERLARLKTEGHLSEEEYQSLKRKLLA